MQTSCAQVSVCGSYGTLVTGCSWRQQHATIHKNDCVFLRENEQRSKHRDHYGAELVVIVQSIAKQTVDMLVSLGFLRDWAFPNQSTVPIQFSPVAYVFVVNVQRFSISEVGEIF